MSQVLSDTKRALMVYAASQTYTAAVFEHVNAFSKYSEMSWSYVDMAIFNNELNSAEFYDVLVIHFSVRLPFGQLNEHAIAKLRNFQGLKVLFIQDEYDHTNLAKKTIGDARFDLVFSVVPRESIPTIYPSKEFPWTRFINCLTGYVPDDLISKIGPAPPPSARSLFLAYRGRSLPIRYGRLGQEKVMIGRHVKTYCVENNIPCDVEWTESSRIYGTAWYEFIVSAKAMLGSESGSNVFDWDGDLQETINYYCKKSKNVDETEVYRKFIKKREVDGLMNQISPRIFEMAAAKTVMVLFEGSYSGVLEPGTHFLMLKKDFSNLKDVIAALRDDAKVDALAERAFNDIVLSGKFSYQQFICTVDKEISASFDVLKHPKARLFSTSQPFKKATKNPIYMPPALPSFFTKYVILKLFYPLILALWLRVPLRLRPYINKLLGRV